MDRTTQEIVDFTKELVATPSQNGIDWEVRVAKLLSKKLQSLSLKPEVVGPKDHPSVICSIQKPDSKKTVWLEAMLDTVPAGDERKWDYPPFEGKVVGNKLYGRGAADSKVAVAIFCYLAKTLVEDREFHGSLFLGFDADEQSGDFTGIREVIKHTPKSDACVLGYQGIEEISIGARGWLRLKLTTHGKSAHTGSRSQKGINAIHLMAQAINAVLLRDLATKKEPFFEFGSSLHFSQIEGGTAINVVPDKCEVMVDIRLLPSQKKDEVLAKIKGALGDIDYSLEELQYEHAYLTNPEDLFVRLLQRVAQGKLGKDIPLVASGQGSVGNVISQREVPIINAFGCESDNVHAPNEWVNIETIPVVFEIYKQTLVEFCK